MFFFVFFKKYILHFWLSRTSIFNLGASGWFLLNFKGSENEISEESENHHFDT